MESHQQKKELIAEIAKWFSEYEYPEQRKTQARSVDKLAIDIYSSSEHFVYELIQNADDASDSVDDACIQLCFTGEYLIVSHDGRKFSDEDIKAVCGIDSQKVNSTETTGYKGIGFKSVFSRSDWVYISSNGFSFRFDKNYPSWDDTYPWQMIPIWTDKDSLPSVVKTIIDQTNHTVVTVIKIKDLNTANDVKEKIFKLFEKTQIILFLRHVKKIIIKSDLGTESELIIERRNEVSNGVSQSSLWQNSKHESSWLIKKYTIEVSDNMRNSVINIESKRKLSQTTSVKICFAGKIEDNKLVKLESYQSSLFAYLPTSVSLGLPILVNGDFVLPASREQLSDNDWNKELISQTGYFLIQWLEELAQTNSIYRNQILAYLPPISGGWISDNFKRSFNEGLRTALREIAFIPDTNNGLSKTSDLILDETQIYTVIPELIRQYFGYQSDNNSKFVDPQLIDQNKLLSSSSSTGLKVFKNQDLKKLFEDKSVHIQITTSICCRIINFLYANKSRDNTRICKGINLEELSFILSHKNSLLTPSKIFLRPQSLPQELDLLADHFHFVHDDILSWLKNNSQIKKWLCDNLLLREPTHQSIIQDVIAPNCSELTDTKQKSLHVVRYLFNQFQSNNSIFTNDVCKKLSALHLIRQDGQLNQLCSVGGFLSDYYQPNFLLESGFDNISISVSHILISDEYPESASFRKDWNRFFVKIGVYDDLIINVNHHQKYTELKKEYPVYCEFVFNEKIKSTKYAPYVNRDGQHHIQNFSYTMFASYFPKNIELAKLFLNYLIPKLKEKFDQTPSTYYYVYDGQNFEVTPYWLFLLQKEACFPTTLGDCRRAEEVIITNEFREIAGNCLPILDLTKDACKWLLENNLPFINSKLPFITKLNIDHYLTILSHLAENNENKGFKNSQENVTLIYAKISSLIPDEDTLNKINVWKQTGKILALDGKFYDPSSLCCLPDKQFSIDHGKNFFVALDYVDQAIISFLKQINVQVLSNEQISLQPENPITHNALKDRILNRIPLIALIQSSSTQNIDDIFDSLWSRICEYEFVRVNSLSLNVLNKLQQSTDFGFDSNSIYFVGEWHTPKILYKIVEKLCSIWALEPNDYSHKIDFILRSSIDSGKDWLQENSYSIDILNILSSKINELISRQNTFFSTSYNDKAISSIEEDGASRSLQQQEYDKETGRMGESFVFKQLQNYLSINSSFSLIFNDTGFQIENTIVVWNNISSESNLPYDFEIIHNQNHYFIEVKSTTYSESFNNQIYLSSNEWEFFKRTKGNYFIARVFSTRENPIMKMIHFNGMNIEQIIAI